VKLAWLALALAACDSASHGATQVFDRPDAGFIIRVDSGLSPAPDAAPPPSEEDCAQGCGRLADCAAAGDPACPAIDADHRDAVLEPCMAGCRPSAEVAASLATIEECGALIAWARDGIPPVAVACAPHGDVPECVTFGQSVARCVNASCAMSQPYAVGIGEWLKVSCRAALEQGAAGPSDFSRNVAADTPCDDPVMGAYVAQVIGDGAPAAGLCTDGPVLPDAVCAAGCRNVNRCAAPGSSLGDYDLCAFYCAILGDLRDAFQCASRNVGCDAMVACFN
jgi:hypothetical protein